MRLLYTLDQYFDDTDYEDVIFNMDNYFFFYTSTFEGICL